MVEYRKFYVVNLRTGQVIEPSRINSLINLPRVRDFLAKVGDKWTKLNIGEGCKGFRWIKGCEGLEGELICDPFMWLVCGGVKLSYEIQKKAIQATPLYGMVKNLNKCIDNLFLKCGIIPDYKKRLFPDLYDVEIKIKEK